MQLQPVSPHKQTKFIRKNLFGVRPNTHNHNRRPKLYSQCYHSKNYHQLKTLDVSIEKKDLKSHRTINRTEEANKQDNKSLQKQWKTIQMKNKTIFRDLSFGQTEKYKNSHKFLKSHINQQLINLQIKQAVFQGHIKIQNKEQHEKFERLVEAIINSNKFFNKLERTITQSVVLLGQIKKYVKKQQIVFRKGTTNIGFLLYGSAKYYSKDYLYRVQQGDIIGEHKLLFSHQKINHEEANKFKYPKQDETLNIKFMDETCILWMNYSNYNILRQESIKQGFRHQFNKLDTQLRLNYYKKKNQNPSLIKQIRKKVQVKQ